MVGAKAMKAGTSSAITSVTPKPAGPLRVQAGARSIGGAPACSGRSRSPRSRFPSWCRGADRPGERALAVTGGRRCCAGSIVSGLAGICLRAVARGASVPCSCRRPRIGMLAAHRLQHHDAAFQHHEPVATMQWRQSGGEHPALAGGLAGRYGPTHGRDLAAPGRSQAARGSPIGTARSWKRIAHYDCCDESPA